MTKPQVTVGDRLAQVRRSHNYTQRALAEKAGVSHSTISLIEKNRISPSVGALKRILDSIPMSLSKFFAAEDEVPADGFWYAREDLTDISANRGIALLQIGTDLSEKALQVMHEMFEPGADTGVVMLTHQGEEAGFVVRGSIELTVAGQTRVLNTGDGYYFSSSLPHRFRNPTKERAEIISACTPPSF